MNFTVNLGNTQFITFIFNYKSKFGNNNTKYKYVYICRVFHKLGMHTPHTKG